MTLIACLSGPERTRANVNVALDDARIPHLPDDHHGMMDWASKIPLKRSEDDPDLAEPHGFATVHAGDSEGLNRVASVIEPHGWVLRVHYPEPAKPEPSPETKIAATLDEMRARIAALEGNVGRAA